MKLMLENGNIGKYGNYSFTVYIVSSPQFVKSSHKS